MEIQHKIEAAPDEPEGLLLASDRENLVDVRISFKASREAGFDKNGYAEVGKLLLQCADRTGEEQTVAHRAQPYKQDARPGRQGVQKALSFQPWLR